MLLFTYRCFEEQSTLLIVKAISSCTKTEGVGMGALMEGR